MIELIVGFLMLGQVAISSADDIEYYDVISEYNLFRPLGWKPPNLKPRFELLGTIVGEGFARAYFKNIRNSRIVIVSVGDRLDSDVIKEISSKTIKMESGKEYEGKGLQFLRVPSSRNKRKTGRVSSGNSESKKNDATVTENVESSSVSSRRRGSRRRSGGQNWRDRISRFQSASPEERERMIKEFREQRGN